ncbi:UNVERIFIED_CONTAM: hypothetical protein QOZ14_33015, partial [Pseudomonas aeruginosa]
EKVKGLNTFRMNCTSQKTEIYNRLTEKHNVFINYEMMKNMNNIPSMKPLGHLTAGKHYLQWVRSLCPVIATI